MRTLFLVIMAAFVSLSTLAYDFKANGLCFNITSTSSNTCMITNNPDEEYSGWIDIPSEVEYNGEKYFVTAIAGGAFQGSNNLYSVYGGDELREIGDNAFMNCPLFFSLRVGGKVEHIGDLAFYGCKSLCYLRFEDGDGVLRLERNGSFEGLFYDCPLEDIYIGRLLSYDSEYQSGFSPFALNKTLKTATLGDKAVYVSKNLFLGCSNLTCVNLSPRLTTIFESAFYECKSLPSIVLGDEIQHVGEEAFFRCYNLSTVILGRNVSVLYHNAFQDCTALSRIYSKNSNPPIILSDAGFSENNYRNVSVYVQEANFTTYRYNDYWGKFAHIYTYSSETEIDGVDSVELLDLHITYQRGVLQIKGTTNGVRISVYSLNGKQFCSVVASDKETRIPCNLQKGEVVIVKYGEKVAKVAL